MYSMYSIYKCLVHIVYIISFLLENLWIDLIATSPHFRLDASHSAMSKFHMTSLKLRLLKVKRSLMQIRISDCADDFVS